MNTDAALHDRPAELLQRLIRFDMMVEAIAEELPAPMAAPMRALLRPD